jgi:hypothetical protein
MLLSRLPADQHGHLSHPRDTKCHNLCSFLTPSPSFSSLLGLGLNFCLQQITTSSKRTIDISTDRFRRDIYTKMIFANADNNFSRNQLFIRSDWQSDSSDLPIDNRGRVNYFLNLFNSKFKHKRVPSNLFTHQQGLLDTLLPPRTSLSFPLTKTLVPQLLNARNIPNELSMNIYLTGKKLQPIHPRASYGACRKNQKQKR